MAEAERLGVYFLDVGQGDCSFVLGSGGVGVLFDCADAEVARSFAKDKSMSALDAVVVSHLDADHIRGMHAFLEWWIGEGKSIGELWIDIDRAKLSGVAKELLAAALRWNKEGKLSLSRAERAGHPREVWSQGASRVEIVLPHFGAKLEAQMEGKLRPNPCSAVLRVVQGASAILIGGDAPLASWERLHKSEPERVPAVVFRVPHHGGKIDEGSTAWSTEKLYEEVGASHAVVSVGTNNGSYGHPLPDHVRAMRPGECRVLCTQLTARCHTKPLDLRPGFASRGGVLPAYRHLLHPKKREVPCAGNVAVWIDEAGNVEIEPPNASWHAAFVEGIESPLCRPAPDATV